MGCQGRARPDPELGSRNAPLKDLGTDLRCGTESSDSGGGSSVSSTSSCFGRYWRRESGSPSWKGNLGAQDGRAGSSVGCGFANRLTEDSLSSNRDADCLPASGRSVPRESGWASPEVLQLPLLYQGMSGGCSNSLHRHCPYGGREVCQREWDSGLVWHLAVYQAKTVNGAWAGGARRRTRVIFKALPMGSCHLSYLTSQVVFQLFEYASETPTFRSPHSLSLWSWNAWVCWVCVWGRGHYALSISLKYGWGRTLFQGRMIQLMVLFLGNHSEPSLSDYSSVPFRMVKVEFN